MLEICHDVLHTRPEGQTNTVLVLVTYGSGILAQIHERSSKLERTVFLYLGPHDAKIHEPVLVSLGALFRINTEGRDPTICCLECQTCLET